MKIEVIGESQLLTTQVRAYADTRVFAALARYAPFVRGVRLVIAADPARSHWPEDPLHADGVAGAFRLHSGKGPQAGRSWRDQPSRGPSQRSDEPPNRPPYAC